MAQAQLIRGSGAELLFYLQQHRNRKNLTLIIPDASIQTTCSDTAQNARQALDAAILRNGVPLFPTQGADRSVTTELVRQLMDEG